MSDMTYWILFQDMYCQLLGQSSDHLDILTKLISHSNKITEITLIIVITIWITLSMIVSKAFSEQLLSTYMNRQYIPLIQSMDDVINKKGFRVVMQGRDKDKFNKAMPQYFSKLYQTDIIDWVPDMHFVKDIEQKVEEVAKGKRVMIASEMNNNYFRDANHHLPLVQGYLYDSTYLVTAISKKHPFGKKIRDA